MQELAQITNSKSVIPKLMPATPILFFLYTEPKDLDLVTDISISLRSSFQVKSVDLEKDITDVGINYFYDDDVEIARAVKTEVEKNLTAKGIRLDLNLVSKESLYRVVARGTIEVRLPTLSLSPPQNIVLSPSVK